jgi:hypothetical protein
MLMTALVAFDSAVIIRLGNWKADEPCKKLAFIVFTATLNACFLPGVRMAATWAGAHPEDRLPRQIALLGCLVAIVILFAMPALVIICMT